MTGRFTVCALLVLMLSGCATDLKPKQPANVILEDMHFGGTVVAFNTDSTILASGGTEGHIQLSNVPDGRSLVRLPAHSDTVNGIGFLDATRFISAGYDGRLAVWSTAGKLLREARTPSPVTYMVMNAQYQLMVTGHKDGVVRAWRLPELMLSKEYPLHRGTVLAVAWHAESRRFASSGSDGRVYVWSADTAPRELARAPGDAAALQFSPDGRTLMGGGWFKLWRWEVASGKLEIIPTEHHGLIYRLRYMDDGRTIASVSRHTDSAVYFLDAQNGAVVRRFQAHDLCGADIALSPDSRYLATTSDDYSVRLWDLRVAPPKR